MKIKTVSLKSYRALTDCNRHLVVLLRFPLYSPIQVMASNLPELLTCYVVTAMADLLFVWPQSTRCNIYLSFTKKKNRSGRNEITATSAKLHPSRPQNKRLYTP
jgi:hypothetical protein